MTALMKVLITTISIKIVTCTISGLTYMDSMNLPLPNKNMDPCNPLYWYPQEIPKHCYNRPTPAPPRPTKPQPDVIPLPVPVPIPQSVPLAASGPLIPIPLAPFPIVPPLPPIIPAVPPQLPFGLPLPFIQSSPMLSLSRMQYSPPLAYGLPGPTYANYPYRQEQIGMVPGIPGLVSDNGGINILPFSDVYSDVLERQKNKSLRKIMEKLLRNYENKPRLRRRRLHRKNIYH